ncbi:hypothetical protein QVD17_08070 [Tagetes erecta]|uniref:CRM domain-containing protein n=1 Tax=Tagetes erecta TaxID=13708 RepID=A0AAD8KXQ2_TARER|nr:hypothetical protein QVD17_08070 [Tagetes erecta]
MFVRCINHFSTSNIYTKYSFPFSTSNLYTKYSFTPPPSLLDQKPKTQIQTPDNDNKKKKKEKKPLPSSFEHKKLFKTDGLPFDFRFSYTESSPGVRPIGLREPKYSPFGPNTLDRRWTGVCAPAAPGNGQLEAKRNKIRDNIQGHQLTNAETLALVNTYGNKHKTKRQINLGRDGLTHNMLNDIHNNWKQAEAVRIKCMGVPTVDMENVCAQLEDKAFGKIIHRHGASLILYRGRNYKKPPAIPLMLWKPKEPIYPKLIKTTVEGLTIEETKQMRKKGLALPALTKLAKNGYYGGLVPMIRDAFLVEELLRIDCQALERKDYKKLGSKLRDLVPCILITFEKQQIVIWRGKDYKPKEGAVGQSDSLLTQVGIGSD